MGHGKWRSIDDHGYLEILRKPECGCQWWDNTVWLKKPGLMGIRNQQTSVSMSVYVHFHVWICTHAHVNSHLFKTRTHNCWIPTEELKSLQLWIRYLRSLWVCFSHLRPHSSGALMVPHWSSKAPWNRNQAAPSPSSVSHVGELSSVPQLSLNTSAVFHAFQDRCSGDCILR